MLESVLSQHNSFRLIAFAACLTAFALLEFVFRYRTPHKNVFFHYLTNFSFIAIAYIGFKILGVTLAFEWALGAEAKGWGLFNQVALPLWISVPLSVLLLDFIIYFQHRLFHRFSWLWYLHSLHHADKDFDASTGIRFHPLEIALSMAIKIVVVVILGIPALGVLLFEVLLNATSLFSHSNFSLPTALDRHLRKLLVTPNMHRIHHSVRHEEMNSNFGFNLAVWDKIFRTYRQDAKMDPRTMPIGLKASSKDPSTR